MEIKTSLRLNLRNGWDFIQNPDSPEVILTENVYVLGLERLTEKPVNRTEKVKNRTEPKPKFHIFPKTEPNRYPKHYPRLTEIEKM